MEFSDRYRDFLKQNLVASSIGSGGKEVYGKCKYCSDGRDPRHGHMYVSIPEQPGDISFFYCQLCHESGIVDNKRLIEWGMYDPEIAMSLIKINNEAKKRGTASGFERKVYNISNYIGDINLASQKLEYINQRLGTSLSLSDALANKIVFNIGEVLRANSIQNYTRHPNIISQLNAHFVGFLSIDNNFINMRRVCDEGIVYQSIDKRYINYNIHGKKDNTEKFYISPTIYDMSCTTRIPIHISEGPFDILSVKYNLRNCEPGIYGAITGSAYKGLLMHILNSLKIFYAEVHLYPDNDKHGDDYIMNDIVNYLKPYNIPLYIHRNTMPGEKDFGVRKDRISERITREL